MFVDSHAQGMRRLGRSYVDSVVGSSSESTKEREKTKENADPAEMPVKMTKMQARQALKNIPPFHPRLGEKNVVDGIVYLKN